MPLGRVAYPLEEASSEKLTEVRCQNRLVGRPLSGSTMMASDMTSGRQTQRERRTQALKAEEVRLFRTQSWRLAMIEPDSCRDKQTNRNERK